MTKTKTTKPATDKAADVSHAKQKAAPKAKPTKKDTAAAAVAKMRQASLAVPAPALVAEIVQVPLDVIRAVAQVRSEFDDETIRELAQDIAANGIIQPILLRRNTTEEGLAPYIIVAGERRYRAAKLAGLDAVPAILTELDDQNTLSVQLAENIQREELSTLDTANAVRALYDMHGQSVTATAERLHKSKSWVSKYLAASCNIEWTAKKLLEDGITEDLEIILTVNKIAKLDWRKAKEADEMLRAGEAGRATITNLYNDVKAKAEKEAAEKQAAADAKNTPEAKAKQQKAAAEQKKIEETWKEQLKREAEERARDPHRIAYRLSCNLDEEQPLDHIEAEHREIIETSLRDLHEQGRKMCANNNEFRKVLIGMLWGDDYSIIELDAFIAGYLGAGYDLDKTIELAHEAIKGTPL